MKTIKNILIVLILLSMTSCMTVRRIEKNCDKFAAVCVTESKTVTVYRDTTIYKDRIVKVTLPNDTVRLTDTVTVINNRCYLPMRHKKFGVVWVSASVVNSVLNVTAGLIDSTILIPVRDTIFIEKAVSNTTTDNTVTVVKKFIPGFYKFTFWLFIAIVVVGIGYLVLRFTTLRVPFLKK